MREREREREEPDVSEGLVPRLEQRHIRFAEYKVQSIALQPIKIADSCCKSTHAAQLNH